MPRQKEWIVQLEFLLLLLFTTALGIGLAYLLDFLFGRR